MEVEPRGPRLDEATLARLRALIADSAQPGEDLPARIVALFAEDARAHVGKLRDRLQQDDLEGVAFFAHALKGSAANVGAGRVQALATAVLVRARAGSTAALAVIDAIAHEVEEAIAALPGALAGARAASGPGRDD